MSIDFQAIWEAAARLVDKSAKERAECLKKQHEQEQKNKADLATKDARMDDSVTETPAEGETISEENSERVQALIKGMPKPKKCNDPLCYNPDMKHFSGSLHGEPIEAMKEKDLYDHLTQKRGVKDGEATELITRLKAPHENKEKIDKLLNVSSKFGGMAKKEVPAPVKGKRKPKMDERQKKRWMKYHEARKMHLEKAKKLGYDPKHPLWNAAEAQKMGQLSPTVKPDPKKKPKK
jgi:hypothetical protein